MEFLSLVAWSLRETREQVQQNGWRIAKDELVYPKVVKFIGDKSELSTDPVRSLADIIFDREPAVEIIEADMESMGKPLYTAQQKRQDLSVINLLHIQPLAQRVVDLTVYRRNVYQDLFKVMKDVAPNLLTVIGEIYGAPLIAPAGGLLNLAKFSSSTLQILGAEKAFFRALKTPKHGLIFQSYIIDQASGKNKGRMARCLADKCSLADKCFFCVAERKTSALGKKLFKQVDKRLISMKRELNTVETQMVFGWDATTAASAGKMDIGHYMQTFHS
ncbi:uncharacterized protein LOC130769439 [Actinidia eriantha]|uniref:uncharacterized protein LOC130769439 n=1 Tax=Actinidia eriantha TaxID=165200 RepID=UPI002583C98D|nr:uncharacterized protein LOC130769439 [Actinidia eriantha]